jgi:hypothetical protein
MLEQPVIQTAPRTVVRAVDAGPFDAVVTRAASISQTLGSGITQYFTLGFTSSGAITTFASSWPSAQQACQASATM